MNGKAKFFRVAWVPLALIPVLIIAFLHIPTNSNKFTFPSFEAQFYKKSPAMNVRVLAENSGGLNLNDLPLVTRLHIVMFEPKPRVQVYFSCNGTDTLLIEDIRSKTRYQLSVHFKDYIIRAITLRYPAGCEKNAKALKQSIESEFEGLQLILRKGNLVMSDSSQPPNKTASN